MKKRIGLLLCVALGIGMVFCGCGGDSAVSMNGTERVDVEGDSVSGTDKSLGEEIVQGLSEAGIHNPVHNCTNGTGELEAVDATDWSYVYFGNYPQSEVAGNELTVTIMGASYDENGDAVVDGVKYRRASIGDANRESSFGDSEYRYFKWEPVKWRVLQNDGNTLFVLADKGLDCKDYNEEYVSTIWGNCTLRDWLNDSFYNTAFDSSEQGAIVEQTVMTEDNPDYGTDGGYNTTDKIYLLSIEEVENPEYGFCEGSPDHNYHSGVRLMQASDYACAMGVNDNWEYCAAGNVYWLLRSPGHFENEVTHIGADDLIYKNGGYVNDSDCAVVPALHIDLSSDLWSIADES